MAKEVRVMKFNMATAILLLLSSFPLFADDTIGRCVDENGVITFTDIYCYSTEQIPPLYISKDYKIATASSGNITASTDALMEQLEATLQDAIKTCRNGFGRYLHSKYRHTDANPNIEFDEVIDQYYKQKAQSITVRGKAEFTIKGEQQESVVECTLQNLHKDDQWVVGYFEITPRVINE
jgi:hypothetical protein